jgi:hypothetical protein
MTNREKFKEVFGYTPNADAECVAPSRVCLSRDELCNGCPFENWWDKEYKSCFQIKEGLDE